MKGCSDVHLIRQQGKKRPFDQVADDSDCDPTKFKIMPLDTWDPTKNVLP